LSFSSTNLALNGLGGVLGATYCVLTSTNLKLPLSQWTPVATNVLKIGGSFTITVTNTFSRAAPQQFYILKSP
jgi:fluoride ion exporter CrcB/FEX